MSRAPKVEAALSHHRLIPGKGYRVIGPLPMPAVPLGDASACEPPGAEPDRSLHSLLPESNRGSPPFIFVWYPEKKEWEPITARGRRVAFSSAYLAAHGWTYGGPG